LQEKVYYGSNNPRWTNSHYLPDDYVEAHYMAEARVQQIAHEIRMLTDVERQELVAEVLPLLLLTQGSLQAVIRALDTLSTEELDALVEHARTRNTALPETTLTMVLRDALHATRTPRSA
jgi:hypothetical protein